MAYTITLIFILIIVIIILITALTYATAAAVALEDSAEAGLINAHYYLSVAISIIWIAIGLIIAGVIALIIFGPEFIPLFGKTLVYLVLAIFVIAIVAVGVVASIAASYINSSPAKSTSGDAYEDCILAAIISLGSIGVVAVGYGLTWYANKEPGSDGIYDEPGPDDVPIDNS
jgi:hypothetical protein